MRRISLLAAILLTAVLPGMTRAQFAGRASLIDSQRMRGLGLEKAWYANARVNTSRGGLVNMTLHLRPHVIYRVTNSAGRIFEYSSLDVDPDQITPIGPLEAKKRAEAKLASINVIKGLWSGVEVEAPEKDRGKLERLDRMNMLLVSVSEQGTIDVFDGETGRRKWSRKVGSPQYPSTAAGVNDNLVAVINGLHLYVLENATGDLLWSRSLKGVPGAAPALSNAFAFVPTIDGALESYSLSDLQEPPGRYQAIGRSLVQPVVTPDTVVWPTDRGFYYVAPANKNGIYYRLETSGKAIAKPAYANGKLFMASLDGYVYCLEEMLGQLQWSRAFGEPISQQPLIVEDQLYIRGDYGTLWCLNSSTGETQWTRGVVEQVLGVAGGRVYVASARMTGLVALDAKTGETVGETRLNDPNLIPLTNTLTDRIYLADESGFIQCFRPLGGGEPVAHVELAEFEKPVEVNQPQAPAQPAAKQPAAGGNPFGAGNPFGGGAGGDNPFGGGAGNDNPFGGGGAGGAGGAGNDNPFGGGGAGGAGGAGNANPFGGGGGNPFGGGAGGAGGGAGNDNPFGGGGMGGNDNPFGGN